MSVAGEDIDIFVALNRGEIAEYANSPLRIRNSFDRLWQIVRAAPQRGIALPADKDDATSKSG